ncbi:NAD-dependent protein deacylase [Gudongella sp. DL1XJH-153]|uniref:NAD-dependent protein deacylase n=1 Tax=Gudongella sp. DL1XJH-153 TaxID=3409804 RepID=UPI003BB7E1D3
MSIEKLSKIIMESDNIVFFGGAGVSTESNIPDFRSESGIYSTKNKYGYPPEYLLSHSFFRDHQKEFFNYYRDNMLHPNAKPNKAHLALGKLEELGKLKAVITQNIDGLHQLGGSRNVLEIHGSVHRNYCLSCGAEYPVDKIQESESIPTCDKCGGIVRPDVVLYEEGLDMRVMDKAMDYIRKAQVLIVGGTSLNVYPAAGLVEYFRGKELVLINKTSTGYDNRATLIFRDSIGEVLDDALRRI